jgi:hypothetical protein
MQKQKEEIFVKKKRGKAWKKRGKSGEKAG